MQIIGRTENTIVCKDGNSKIHFVIKNLKDRTEEEEEAAKKKMLAEVEQTYLHNARHIIQKYKEEYKGEEGHRGI